jgi:hypothetical protein
MLTGCQSQPSVAAYVGNTRITVDQVNKIVDDYDATSRANQGGGLADTSFGNAREAVLSDLVLTEAVKHYIDDQKLNAPPVDVEAAAQALGQPASSLYVNLFAETQAYFNMIASTSKAAQPTDADLREIYDRIPHGDVSYDSAKPQIAAIAHLAEAIGARNDIEKMFSRYHVVMNPQYRGTTFHVYSPQLSDGSTIPLVVAPLGTGTDDSDFVSSS